MQTNIAAMIEALLAKMTLEEKLGQLTMARAEGREAGSSAWEETLAKVRAGHVGGIFDLKDAGLIEALQTAAVRETPLGIPLLFALDVLHGFETIFPIPLAEAASFDPATWAATAQAAAEEAAGSGIALTFAPMLDVSRDPRWGRMAESPGEDPWLAAHFAEAKVRGFQQGALSNHRAIAATAKHFAGYGAVTAGRDYNSVDISARTLHAVHLPPFAAAVHEGVAAVMPALSDLAGIPMTAHVPLLRDVLRGRWGFDGAVISDFQAIGQLTSHGVAADIAEAAALAMKAGIDIDLAGEAYFKGLRLALERGLVSPDHIDAAVRRVLQLKARLGLFEDPFARGRATSSGTQKEHHRALARAAASQSIVLLKNRDGTLPWSQTSRHLAIAGPLAAAPEHMLGPWHAAGRASETVSFLEGLQKALPSWTITHFEGARAQSLDGIEAADVVLLCLGETADMCGEAASRAQPSLPSAQRTIAERIFALGKPAVIALSSGRPLIDPWLFENADAVLATWFLGSEAGNALGDVLKGAINPSAKLPVSWPYDVGQIPIFYAEYRTGRPADPSNHDTSKYLDVPVKPLFPFGHGLSFTRFSYRNLRIAPAELKADGVLAVEADIANEGPMAGVETAFLFIHDRVASDAKPVLELRGLTRIKLAAGACGTVRFELPARDLGSIDGEGLFRLEAGEFEIFVGPNAEREMLLGGIVRLSVI